MSSTLCGAAAPARPLGVGFGNFMGISWTLLYRVYLIIYIYIYILYLRMGTRLRYHICSHVHSPYISAKGSRMSPLWLKSLQLQVPEKRAFMPKLYPVVVSKDNSTHYLQEAYMGTRLRYHICSHVHSPYISAKGSRMSPLWLKSLQLQVPEKRAFMPKL